MVQAVPVKVEVAQLGRESVWDLDFQLPDPEDETISEPDFRQQVDSAWLICDRFDLQTDIWRGRILRAVRDREKKTGEGRGTGFLYWLNDREISKSQAYRWIELANSADTLLQSGQLEADAVDRFSKRAFVETAQSPPEVQQLVSESANRGDRITRREVRQVADEWTAMSSDLIPAEIKSKAADSSIPTGYLAPLVREMEKLPPVHQEALKEELVENPDLDTLKQVTSEAKQLAKYLSNATHVQAIEAQGVDLEQALEEALRLGCLNSAADLVNQAAQLEQTLAKLYTTWKRVARVSDRLYVDSGSSTPNLRSLLQAVAQLTGEVIQVELGNLQNSDSAQTIQVSIKGL
ncbi:hypothetical protein [Lyngbya confervoides]|uniref:Uncharacterized protein n=1 Tax=Lyngbya confervoides BDU141951 TaxID=1574623 RepID=A0ABD4T2Q5_9CYAN|nr:hypothetical protein [Lyngbya confervoides]MCM1982822.1 hypothetical protein [Lyngbya confervoides BDU141951]